MTEPCSVEQGTAGGRERHCGLRRPGQISHLRVPRSIPSLPCAAAVSRPSRRSSTQPTNGNPLLAVSPVHRAIETLAVPVERAAQERAARGPLPASRRWKPSAQLRLSSSRRRLHWTRVQCRLQPPAVRATIRFLLARWFRYRRNWRRRSRRLAYPNAVHPLSRCRLQRRVYHHDRGSDCHHDVPVVNRVFRSALGSPHRSAHSNLRAAGRCVRQIPQFRPRAVSFAHHDVVDRRQDPDHGSDGRRRAASRCCGSRRYLLECVPVCHGGCHVGRAWMALVTGRALASAHRAHRAHR